MNASGIEINGLGIFVAIAIPTNACGVSSIVSYDILTFVAMSILPLQIILFAIAVVLYMFFFWRRLKEDYLSGPIFTTSIIVLLTTILSGYVSTFLPIEHLWFWGASIGFIFSIIATNSKFKFKFFELYESGSRSVLILLLFAFVSDYIANNYVYSLYSAIYLIFSIIIFVYIDMNYRKFTWYKSGKVGIAGLAALGFLFLGRSIAGALDFPVVSLLGRIEFIFSGILTFLHFFLIYHLSES